MRAARGRGSFSSGAVVALVLVALTAIVAPAEAQLPAPATFVVTTAADEADDSIEDDVCGDVGECSLREALEQVNVRGGNARIEFAIPGTGPRVIAVDGGGIGDPLPTLAFVQDVHLDGTTQAGFLPGIPAIRLDGAAVTGGNGLSVVGSLNVTIEGLEIFGFSQAGVFLDGFAGQTEHTVTGNRIHSNGDSGIVALDEDSLTVTDNQIFGNGVELSSAGISIQGGTGILVDGNIVGLAADGSPAGNGGAGIEVTSGAFMPSDVTITNNRVESNAGAGIVVAAGTGILVGAAGSGNTLMHNGGAGVDMAGGSAEVTGNTISANTGAGVTVTGGSAEVTSNTIRSNAGDGVNVTGGSAEVTSNTISANTGAGVAVGPAAGTTTILANRIDANGGLGIDVQPDGATGVTPNVVEDGVQDFPILNRVSRTTVNLTLGSPVGTYRIELFRSSSCDPSGHGEGASFQGSFLVELPPSTQTVSLPFTLAYGRITATATEAFPDEGGGFFHGATSEFSPCVNHRAPGGGAPAPTTTATPSPTPTATETSSPEPTETGTDSATETQTGTGEAPAPLDDGTLDLARIVLLADGRLVTKPLDGVNGRVQFLYEGPGAGDAVIVLVHPDGTEQLLGPASEPLDLDTSELPNGVYQVQVRSGGGEGLQVLQSGRVLKSERVLVFNAPSTPEEAFGAALVGVGMVAVGAGILSTLWPQFAAAMAEAGKESAIAVGEDRLRGRKSWRGGSLWVSLSVFLVAVALLGIFFAVEAVEAALRDVGAVLGELWQALPVIGSAALAFFALAFALEIGANMASGNPSRLRFLWPGAVSLALSALLFRTAFGYPGYVDEPEGRPDPAAVRMRGVRALAVFGSALWLLMLGMEAGLAWHWPFGEVVLAVGLVALCTATLPFAPLPGADVWAWRKALSALTFLATFALFFAFQLGFLPFSLLRGAGWAGAVFFLAGVYWMVLRRRAPRPAWYARVVGRYAAMEARIAAATPAWWVRFRVRRAQAAHRARTAIGRPVRAAARRLGAAVGRARRG